MPTAQVVTTTEKTYPTVKKISWDWLATDAGVVSSATTARFDGELLGATFIPDSGGTAPDDNYDVTLLDADSTDVLCGLGINLSNAATVTKKHSDGLGAVSDSVLTLTISGAGDANGGVIHVWIR